MNGVWFYHLNYRQDNLLIFSWLEFFFQWEVMPDLIFYCDPEEADMEERERLEAAN
jgi:hypothetical protein